MGFGSVQPVHFSLRATHRPPSSQRSASFLRRVCTALGSVGKCSASPHSTSWSMWTLGSRHRPTCLDTTYDISSTPEPCCVPKPWSGKVAPGSTVFSGFQPPPGPGPQAKEYRQQGFQGTIQPLRLSLPPGHILPPV